MKKFENEKKNISKVVELKEFKERTGNLKGIFEDYLTETPENKFQDIYNELNTAEIDSAIFTKSNKKHTYSEIQMTEFQKELHQKLKDYEDLEF